MSVKKCFLGLLIAVLGLTAYARMGGPGTEKMLAYMARVSAWDGGDVRPQLSRADYSPVIASFSPLQGQPGSVVTIRGTSLAQVTSVRFGSKTLVTPTSRSFTELRVTVPADAVTGKIIVFSAKGKTISNDIFTVGVFKPTTDQDAARFLQQTTFAHTAADVARVKDIGYEAWLDEQMALPVQFSHLAQLNKVNPGVDARAPLTNDIMWLGMVNSSDQLRQRQMFALSQIFVISNRDGSTYYWGRSLSKYVDNLYAHGFGNYRDLLEAVALNPAMGNFLSHAYNRKEDPATGAVPDQNFAREMMQLFSIGLWELNQDGTRKLDTNGNPIPTYTRSDVVGASRVLTGWAPMGATDIQWERYYCFCQQTSDIPSQSGPMVANNKYHSTSEKKFLGVTIPAGSSNAAADLKILLDRIHNHPNVGPFIGKQLIQRFVTSNPSPAYVSRVAAKFNDNGVGVRGDMKAVIKAIFLDQEARDPSYVSKPDYGKIREPILRMAQLMRTFKAKAPTDPNSFGIGQWEYDKRKGLWQSPLGSLTVFNFYFPNYTPPNSALSRNGLVAPEMQITSQSSVPDMDFFFRDIFENGGITDCCSDELRNTFYMKLDYTDWLPLVSNPTALADKLNQQFMAGQMPSALKQNIINAMNEEDRDRSPTSGIVRGNTQMKLAAALRAMVLSPEYVVQK